MKIAYIYDAVCLVKSGAEKRIYGIAGCEDDSGMVLDGGLRL